MGFHLLFWGFLFMFDFRIQQVDVLPDFIGYLFFYMGLSSLSVEREEFAAAKRLAPALIILSIPSIHAVSFAIDDLSGFRFLMLALNLTVVILDLLMVYRICKGIEGWAYVSGNGGLGEKARLRWMMYLSLALLPLALLVLALIDIQLAALLLPLTIIYALVVSILMMMLMKESERHFKSLSGPGGK